MEKNGIPKCDFSFSLGKVRLIDVPFEFYWDTNDSYKNGAQTIWYENGQKEYEFNYKDGIRNGEGLCWHENGQLHIKENILDGKLDGKLVNWYECGQISVEEHYAKGVKHGDFTSWYENGQIGRKCRFMNGKLVGPYVRWYENGQKLSDGNFTDGELHGLQSIFFKSENKSAEYYYKKGNCITAKVWLPNGEICPETTLENGNGHRVLWHENGQKAEMFLFKDGKLDGIAREWHENGMMSYERNFKEGKLHGLVTSWSEAGEQNYQINYVNGKEVDLPEDSPEVTIGNKVFSLDELDRIPLAIKNGDLVYPESLLGKGLSGEVKLLIQINERGRVMVMEILSATHPLFGKAASIAAENSLYEIPTRDGKPVSAQFHLLIKFTASQPSWSASEQISHNYKHGKVRLELSYMHQLDGLKKDQEEKFSTETILLVDGNFVYALIHAMDGPLRVSFNPHTLISMQGRITSQKLSKPITINEVAFMDDPRIIIVPLYANPEELRKPIELFEAPANPYLFDDAVCMDVGKGKLGRIKCMRDQIDGRYIEVDERSFAFETGAINPEKATYYLHENQNFLEL